MPWTQELIWVKRNERSVVVAFSEKLPGGVEDFVPILPMKEAAQTIETEELQ